MLHIILALNAITDMIGSLLQLLATPVLIPLAISGITWLVDKYTTLTDGMNVWLKRLFILVVPAGLAAVTSFVSAKLGFALDLSSMTAAGGSIVAMLIYMIGKKSSTTA